MNCQQAKDNIDINDFLQSHGYKPVRKSGVHTFYFSPFRKEKTPSFKTNSELKCYIDFGDHRRGEYLTVVDLATELFNCDISQALNILSGSKGIISPTVKQKIIEPTQQSLFDILEVKPLNNPALIQYLESRKINIDIAKIYLKEMYYTYKKDNKFFGLCFGNDLGNGYEVRNKSFKGFIGSEKTITTINEKENNTLAIFEGYIDFLSYLTKQNKEKLESTSIILNGASMLLQAIEKIEEIKPCKIYEFLDNDTTGIETAKTIQDTIKNIPVLDKSDIYSGYKDLNDLLTGKKKND